MFIKKKCKIYEIYWEEDVDNTVVCQTKEFRVSADQSGYHALEQFYNEVDLNKVKMLQMERKK